MRVTALSRQLALQAALFSAHAPCYGCGGLSNRAPRVCVRRATAACFDSVDFLVSYFTLGGEQGAQKGAFASFRGFSDTFSVCAVVAGRSHNL